MTDTPWPSTYEYALAHPCPTCKAPAGQDCDAPQKRRSQEKIDDDLAAARQPAEDDRIGLQHATRQDLGIAHYNRDVAAAPWPEDREPGKRHDSLPRTG